MNEASSLARNATAAASSSGSANRPTGMCTRRRCARSGSFANSSCSSGVFTGPGQSAFTRMPWRANCTPSSRLIASTPPFDAVYEICDVAEPSTATNDAVLMIEPRPCATMCRSAAREQRYTDFRLTSCTFCHAGSSVVSMESSSGGEMPALLNAMSTEPYASAAVSKRWSTCASSVTSTCTNRPSTRSAAAGPAVASRSPITTFAPSAARRFAVASPMPDAPPVMTATRPASRCVRSMRGRSVMVLLS